MSRTEINMDDLGNVAGGSYVTVSMTIGDIIGTDRNLVNMLAKAGIPVTGSKSMKSMSLYEVANTLGIDPYSLEDKMNQYLSGK